MNQSNMQNSQANFIGGAEYGEMGMSQYDRASNSLFFWITITMFWVLMILSITALVKYITHASKGKK